MGQTEKSGVLLLIDIPTRYATAWRVTRELKNRHPSCNEGEDGKKKSRVTPEVKNGRKEKNTNEMRGANKKNRESRLGRRMVVKKIASCA